MSQNLLSVGFNLPELESERQKVIALVRSLYSELDELASSAKSPINLTGLTQLNTSTNSADNALKKINTTLSEFDARLRGYNTIVSQTALLEGKLTALYTEEAARNTELKVAIEQRTKALKESALASNEDYQTRKAASDVSIQQAKIEADTIKAVKAQEIAIQQEQIALWQEAEAVATSVAATQIKAEKAEAAALIEANQQKIKSLRDLEANLTLADRASAKEAKTLLESTDEYKQLIAAQKSAQQRFTTSYISAGGKSTPEVEAARQELAQINASITQVDKGLERAGSAGASTLGRNLTSALSSLRTMAYILPGIGIAGIFNLAYEAVIKAGEALSHYNEVLADEAKLEEFVVTQINAANEARINAIKYGTQLSFLESQIQSTKEQLSVSQSLGAEYYTQYEIQKKLTDEEKTQATAILLRETGIKNANEAYTQQLVNVGKVGEELQRLNKQQSVDVLKIEPGKETDYYKTVTEQRAKVISQVQKDFEYQKKILDDYDKARVDSENNEAEHTKFVSDETRKIILDNVKKTTSEIISESNIVLSKQTSSEQERIDSIKRILNAQKELARAEYNDVQTNISATPREKNILAPRDLNDKVLKANEDAAQKALEIREQFYELQRTSENKFALDEIDTEAHKNEYIYQNDKNSYSDRVQALSDYIEDRKKYIIAQENYELDIARKTTPKDLLPQKELEIQKNADKELVELSESTRDKITSVVSSWYKRQLEIISDNAEAEVTTTKESETQQLLILNKSLEDKKISYKKFSIEKKQLEQKFLEKGDLSQINDDAKTLEDLLSVRADLTSKILEAEQKITSATNPQDKEDSTNELNSLLDQSKNLEGKIGDIHRKSAEDQLKYEEDKNKLIEDGKREQKQLLLELEREAFDDIKEVVDAEYEYRIDKIQKLQEAYDRQIDSEKDAIDRSTLNQKDKIAYEVQLTAQKEASDKAAAKQERKLKHDEAVFNRDADIAQIILNTEVAITEALKIPVIGEGLAITYAAIGAAALTTALAVKIPSFAKGVRGFEGGYARFGEAGTEAIKEPNRPTYYAFGETIKFLPKGTDIIPMHESPVFYNHTKDNSWEQTRFLANAISRSNKSVKNVVKNSINIDLGYQLYKHSIIHGEG